MRLPLANFFGVHLHPHPRQGLHTTQHRSPVYALAPFGKERACYFFSRLERDGAARFISYHFSDKPELTGQFSDAKETIKLLTEV